MSSHFSSCKVRITDSAQDGFLKPTALLQMLQESATEHARVLGVGIAELGPQNLGWALSKIIVDVRTMPKWGERVEVETWPSVRDRISTCREFVAKSADGGILFCARSQWLLFDTVRRRIERLSRLPDWPRDELRTASQASFETPFEKSDSADHAIECSARNDDIDLNGHVNNAVYLAWALESLPSGFAEAKTPERIAINFLGEVMPRAAVRIECSCKGGRSVHSVISADASRECARINIDWKSA